MKHNFKKLVSLVLVLAISFAIAVPAFAAKVSSENQSITQSQKSTQKAKNFFSSKSTAIQKLNQVAKAPIKESKIEKLPDGTKVKVEIREIKVSDDLSIQNVRTYTIPDYVSLNSNSTRSSSTQTATDKYGLMWQGFSGAAGYLVASYKYAYESIDGPNHMKTHMYKATGSTQKLDTSYYKVSSIDFDYDPIASYDPSGYVSFNMKYRTEDLPGFPWGDVTYTNHCTFDSKGVPSFSWD